jgi:hypothetical protein
MHKFGEIVIAHENESMVSHVEWSADEERFKLRIDQPGEYYRVNCPFCTDTRRRLWINHMWGFYNERCRSRNLWLAACYNESCLQRPGYAYKLYEMIFSDVTNRRQAVEADVVEVGEKPAGLCQEARPPGVVYPLHELPFDHPANLYLRKRGYDTDMLGRTLQVGWCSEASCRELFLAANRVIIPIWLYGTYVGWQAREIEERESTAPKYFTMPGMKKRGCLYNYDIARNFDFVVVTEGVTKVWSVGPESVAILGKKLSSWQAQAICGTWKKAVIYLDGSAAEEALEAKDALRSVPEVALVQLPSGKEPGDFSIDYNRQLIYYEAKRQGIALAGLKEESDG